jgi:hypothetical protein
MTVLVECMDASVDRPRLESDLKRRFKEALSVQIAVAAEPRGELDAYTGSPRRPKSSVSTIAARADRVPPNAGGDR